MFLDLSRFTVFEPHFQVFPVSECLQYAEATASNQEQDDGKI